MAMWSPWRGCHKISEGCKFCYIHKGDFKRGVDTNQIVKTENFYAPIERNKKGEYKIKPGSMVYVCFSADFLIQEADEWRKECWEIIRERSDLQFLFLTKRIDRFLHCIPADWGNGYENVTVGCTVENQNIANARLSLFSKLPIKHKNIIAQPLIEKLDIEPYLNGVELVLVGGEQDKNARPLHFEWVLYLKEQCKKQNVPFAFRQTGTKFFINGEVSKKTAKELTQTFLQ